MNNILKKSIFIFLSVLVASTSTTVHADVEGSIFNASVESLWINDTKNGQENDGAVFVKLDKPHGIQCGINDPEEPKDSQRTILIRPHQNNMEELFSLVTDSMLGRVAIDRIGVWRPCPIKSGSDKPEIRFINAKWAAPAPIQTIMYNASNMSSPNSINTIHVNVLDTNGHLVVGYTMTDVKDKETFEFITQTGEQRPDLADFYIKNCAINVPVKTFSLKSLILDFEQSTSFESLQNFHKRFSDADSDTLCFRVYR